MKFSRHWAMPNSNTFDIPVIEAFVKKHLYQSKVSVDPFARNKRWATHTNDLNPETEAEHHLEAAAFLRRLEKSGVSADVVLFDPPYSARQISECYQSVGRMASMEDTQSSFYTRLRDLIAPICTKDVVVLSFGWNSVGMGKKHGFEIEEIILVCHGGAHNDTICLAERRIPQEQEARLL